MTTDQKKEIQEKLNEYVGLYPSQAKAADSLKNVSEANVINIRKGNWDSISDEMWRKVAKQIGYSAKEQWVTVQTANFRKLTALFDDAKEHSNVYAITAHAGASKTHTTEAYCKTRPNAYHLKCSEYFNRKTFLVKLLDSMGKSSSGTVAELVDYVVEVVIKVEDPIIIIDEADKLNDQVLYFFITLYNMLEGKCSIVLLSTDQMEKRISRGLRIRKKGYEEIFSRFGRRFIELGSPSSGDVAEIAKANGVTEPAALAEICNECEGDLRRVKRAVHRFKKIKGN